MLNIRSMYLYSSELTWCSQPLSPCQRCLGSFARFIPSMNRNQRLRIFTAFNSQLWGHSQHCFKDAVHWKRYLSYSASEKCFELEIHLVAGSIQFSDATRKTLQNGPNWEAFTWTPRGSVEIKVNGIRFKKG